MTKNFLFLGAFDETALRRLVDMIADESKKLLEIVNFNVEGEQYVCAGHVSLNPLILCDNKP
jgi:malonyl CoA-acyl carrier protein transacylase